MKPFLKGLFVLPLAVGGLALIVSGHASAQTLTILHTFANTVFALNTDGTGFTKLHDFTGS